MTASKAAYLSIVCGLVSVLTPVGAIRAAGAAPSVTRPPAMQSVLDCRAIADGVARLACYDKAVGAMAAAEKSGDLVAIDREQRRVVRRQAFGLTLPSLAIFDKGEKPEEADRVTATLAEAHQIVGGKWVLKLDDGAVWRQTDDYDLPNAPRKGSTAEIRKGVLGAFFIKVDGQQAFRAHRDN
jgi:hypothetical protein